MNLALAITLRLHQRASIYSISIFYLTQQSTQKYYYYILFVQIQHSACEWVSVLCVPSNSSDVSISMSWMRRPVQKSIPEWICYVWVRWLVFYKSVVWTAVGQLVPIDRRPKAENMFLFPYFSHSLVIFFLLGTDFVTEWMDNIYLPKSTSSIVGSNSFSSSVGKKLWFLQFSVNMKIRRKMPNVKNATTNVTRSAERRFYRISCS